MKKASFGDLKGDQVQDVLRLISHLSSQRINDVVTEFLTAVGAEASARTWNNNPRMKTEWGPALAKMIEGSDVHVRETLFSFCASKYNVHVKNPIQTLATWIHRREVRCPDFIYNAAKRGENRLRYLVFRSEGDVLEAEAKRDNKCKVSLLEIEYDLKFDFLPTFRTLRKESQDEADDKLLEGMVFDDGKSIYTIGKVPENPGVRFARLTTHGRNKRTDLYGIRLGYSYQNNRQFAHNVYAYQINPSTEENVEEFLQMKRFNDPIFAEIDDGTQKVILNTVCVDGLMEGGLQIEQMLP